ncbi:MAG: DUF1707 domain-containing protein [Streptosporangiaceae bacterium]|jgi:hypothetical protein
MRASDADRDLAVDILRVAAGEGRLTAAELDERLETALTARTISELVTLTADLPAGTMLQRPGQDHDDPAGGRWTSLRSLLDSPRTYRLLPD